MTDPKDRMATPTRLRRAYASVVFHEATCPRVGSNSVPWIWAEGKTAAEVNESRRNGLRPCKICNPMGLAR